MNDEIHKALDKIFTPGTSGAQSSHGAPRFDLIPLDALKEIANRYALGSERYADFNWEKGLHDEKFILDRYNHILHHLMLWREQHRNENDIGEDTRIGNMSAAAWGCITLLAFMCRRQENLVPIIPEGMSENRQYYMEQKPYQETATLVEQLDNLISR